MLFVRSSLWPTIQLIFRTGPIYVSGTVALVVAGGLLPSAFAASTGRLISFLRSEANALPVSAVVIAASLYAGGPFLGCAGGPLP